MSKDLIYQIIDNKIDKIVYNKYKYTLTDDDLHLLLSAIKLSKSKNLTLDLSNIYLYNKDVSLYKIFNYLKNDKKITKLNLSDWNLNNNDFNKINFIQILNDIKSLQSKINNYNKYYNQQTNDYINNIKYIINQIDTSNIINPVINIINETFKNNTTLQSLNISYNSKHFNNIVLKSLIDNNTIKTLNVSDYSDNNTLILLTSLLNKNTLTSLKVGFSLKLFKNFTDFKNFLKSIEINTSLQQITINLKKGYFEIEFLLLLLIDSILKNNHIKILKLKLKGDKICINTFNYLLLNNKYLETITFKAYTKNYYKIIFFDNIDIDIYNNTIDKNDYIYECYNNILLKIKEYYFIFNDEAEIENDFNNIMNNIITKDINLYKYIDIKKYSNNKYDSGYNFISYYININDYINQIKNININKLTDDNYKSYYKQLQDKLNSTNIVFKNEK